MVGMKSIYTCGFREGSPATFAMGLDVGDEALVLFLGPCTLVDVSLIAARRPAHS